MYGGTFNRLVIAMKYVWIEIVAVGPYDGPQLGVHTYLAEVVEVLERFGHLSP